MGVASLDDALGGDAGKSERGVAWISPPIAGNTVAQRERLKEREREKYDVRLKICFLKEIGGPIRATLQLQRAEEQCFIQLSVTTTNCKSSDNTAFVCVSPVPCAHTGNQCTPTMCFCVLSMSK